MCRETYSVGDLTYHHVVFIAVVLAIKSAYVTIRLVMDKYFDGKKCRQRALSHIDGEVGWLLLQYRD